MCKIPCSQALPSFTYIVITSDPSAGQYHRRVPAAYFDRSTSVGAQNWIQEFEQLNLPLFTEQYIRLVHVPLDVIQECLRLQLEMRAPQQPSLHSVKQVRGKEGGGRGGEGGGVGEEWGRSGGRRLGWKRYVGIGRDEREYKPANFLFVKFFLPLEKEILS